MHPVAEFDLPIQHPHDNFHPLPEPRMELPLDFERPRIHHDEFEHERFARRDRRDSFVDERRMMDDFDGRAMRVAGSEFFPPRDNFGPPRGPMIRGPGPDGFPSRNMQRGPGPRPFPPRAPLLRGPRPGKMLLRFSLIGARSRTESFCCNLKSYCA